MFKGMQERMRKEITALAPSNMTPEVSSPADRMYSCWLGGAILSGIKNSRTCGSRRKNTMQKVPELCTRNASET